MSWDKDASTRSALPNGKGRVKNFHQVAKKYPVIWKRYPAYKTLAALRIRLLLAIDL
jgi:hypothetical protein